MPTNTAYAHFLDWLTCAAPALAILESWGKTPTTLCLFRLYLDGLKPHEVLTGVA